MARIEKMRSKLRRVAGLLICVAFVFSALLIPNGVAAPSISMKPPAVMAHVPQQARQDDGRYQVALGFFERLFKRRSKKKEAPKSAGQTSDAPKKPAAPRAPVIQTVKKDPDAAVIAVFGDEFSQDLAWGLKDAFAQVPDVRVDVYARAASGLVYRAGRNPLEKLETLIEDKPFRFAVMMVGLNDRVKMPRKKNANGEVVLEAQDFRTNGWDRAYQGQVDRLRLLLAEQDKPVFWVGLPPVSNKKLAADMQYLNDLVSARLTERGEEFIDIWDAFSGEDGAFTFRGPDLNGQETRLRQKNGIRFNKAGRRKLAFYVEKLVIRALSQSVDEDVLPLNLEQADEVALREGRGANRDIYALRKPPLDSDKLVNPVIHSLSFDGGASRSTSYSNSRAPSYRADDFSWAGRAEP